MSRRAKSNVAHDRRVFLDQPMKEGLPTLDALRARLLVTF
jgi:hypothetical protein